VVRQACLPHLWTEPCPRQISGSQGIGKPTRTVTIHRDGTFTDTGWPDNNPDPQALTPKETP
jgi:hypothetical protein